MKIKWKTWTLQIILNYMIKQLMEMLEHLAFRLADYLDALTVKLQKQNKKRRVIPQEAKRAAKKTAIKTAEALAG